MAVKVKAKKNVKRSDRTKARREDVVKAVYQLTRRLGMPPTLREVAGETDSRVATIHLDLRALQSQGLLRGYGQGSARAMTLAGAAWGDWCGKQVYAAEMTQEGMRLALILSFGGSGRGA